MAPRTLRAALIKRSAASKPAAGIERVQRALASTAAGATNVVAIGAVLGTLGKIYVDVEQSSKDLPKLEAKVDKLEAKLESKMDKMEAKVDKLEAKMESKLDKMESKLDKLESKMEAMEKSLSRIMVHLKIKE